MLTKLGFGFLLTAALLLGYHVLWALIGLGTSDSFDFDFFSITEIFGLEDDWLQGAVPLAALRAVLYQVSDWPLFLVALGLSILFFLSHMAFSKIG